ncbi:MAG: glycosyltransferase family 2 protein [Bacteroidota bacterium]
MKVSIITATYNSASTVADTLDCIANQSYAEIEHIVIDGLSTDETLKIVRKFPHVDKIISEKDQGIYDAMNKGITQASGEIIGILNSDDFYPNTDVIQNVVNAFKTQKVDSIYGDLQYIDQAKNQKVIRYWRAGNFKTDGFLWGWMPPHPTFFVRKSIYEKFGLFDLNLKSAADYELMLRFLHKEKISTHYLSQVLVKMRTGGQSNATLKNRLLANREDRLAWKRNDLTPFFFTTWLKPLRKINQFFVG